MTALQLAVFFQGPFKLTNEQCNELAAAINKHFAELPEREEKQAKWNGLCKCGHDHDSHNKIMSHNYSASSCNMKGCGCRYFIYDSTNEDY